MPVCSTQAGEPAGVPAGVLAGVPAGPLNHKQLQNNNLLGHEKTSHFQYFDFSL